LTWNHGTIDRHTPVQQNRNCDRKLIAASGAVNCSCVPLCCSRAQHDDGKFRTASDYVSLHPHARAAGTPTGRSPFPDLFFAADERVPTNLGRGNNVARPYQPTGLFRRAPLVSSTRQGSHPQHLLPTVLSTVIPTGAGRRFFPSIVRERVDPRSGGISLRCLAQAKRCDSA
jgi:hypothetical protein